MTRITISDDLKAAVDEAFPDEEIDAVVERLLKAAVATNRRRSQQEAQSIISVFDALAAKFPRVSSQEVDRLRKEGRS